MQKLLNKIKKSGDIIIMVVGLREYHCDICKSVFDKKKNIKTHLKTSHMQLVTIPCDYCENSYTQPEMLKKHIKSEHDIKSRNFEILNPFLAGFAKETSSAEKVNLITFCILRGAKLHSLLGVHLLYRVSKNWWCTTHFME